MMCGRARIPQIIWVALLLSCYTCLSEPRSVDEVNKYIDALERTRATKWSMPIDMRINGLAYLGAAARLRRVVDLMIEGKPVAIGAVGGSITATGCGGGCLRYVDWFFEWVKVVFPAHAPGAATTAKGGRRRLASLPTNSSHVQIYTLAPEEGGEEPSRADARGQHENTVAGPVSAAMGAGHATGRDLQSAGLEEQGEDEIESWEGAPLAGGGTWHDSIIDDSRLGGEQATAASGRSLLKKQKNVPSLHRLIMGAAAGTTSSYMSACLDRHLTEKDQEALDIVFVEYAINDHSEADRKFEHPGRRAFERLLRKLLSMPRKPAVVLVNMFGYCKLRTCGVYWANAERDYMEMATYYGIQVLSLKAAAFHQLDKNISDPSNMWNIKTFYGGGRVHPAAAGHRLVAEMMITMIIQTINNAAVGEPLGLSSEAATEAAAAPIPRPMIFGNHHAEHTTCFIGENFEAEAVVKAEGFTWKNETNKFGFIAFEAGAVLELELKALGAVIQAAADEDPASKSKDPRGRVSEAVKEAGPDANAVIVQIAYLKSYEHMGKFSVECVSGCKCKETVADGHQGKKESLTAMHDVLVQQHPRCRMRITVLSNTNSGEHKVKIIGAVISEEAGILAPLVSNFGHYGTRD